MTVDEMLDRISAHELAEWGEEYKLMPFGSQWQQTTRICGVIADAMGMKKKDGSSFTDADFYPFLIKRVMSVESSESIAAKLTVLADRNKQANKKKKK